MGSETPFCSCLCFFCYRHAITNPKTPVATEQRQRGFNGLVAKALNGDSGDLDSVFRSGPHCARHVPSQGMGNVHMMAGPCWCCHPAGCHQRRGLKTLHESLSNAFPSEISFRIHPLLKGKGAKFIEWSKKKEINGDTKAREEL